MDDSVKHHCGLFGIFGHRDAARLTYLGLYSLQHRGEEAAGMAWGQGADVPPDVRRNFEEEVLRELLHRVEEPGYLGDRVVTDAWAEELGLRDWYEWRRLDEVR